MAIVSKIDNGDGSYTVTTDTGDTMRMGGDAVRRAVTVDMGAPPSAAPPTLDPSIVAAAAPGPDTRTASMADMLPASVGAAFAGGGPSAPPPSMSDAPIGPPAPLIPAGASLQMVRGLGPSASPPVENKPALGTMDRLAAASQGIIPAPAPPPPPAAKAPAGPPVFMNRPAGGAGTGGGPPPMNPNQLVKLSQSTTSNNSYVTPLSKTEKAEQDKAKEAEIGAARGESDAKSAKALQEADLHAGTIADLQASQARQGEIEAQRREEMDRRMARLDQLSKDAAAEKIDPNHFYADKDTSYKITTALMQGLSAYAATRSGGPAYAVNMVKDNIERDIAAQTANLKNKRDTIAGETNLLGQMRQEYGDRAAAESATRLAMLGVAKERLDEIGARNMPAQQRAQFEVLQAGIEKKYLDERQKLDRHQISTSSTAQFAPAGMLGGPGNVDKETEAQAGKYGEAVEKAGLNEVDASLANVDKVLKENLGKSEIPGIGPENFLTRGYKATADAIGGTGTGAKHIYNPKERANQQTLEFVKADLRHALTGAGMSDTERASLDNMITSASNYSDIANTVRILRNKSAAHRQGLAGGFRPEAVQLYNQRRGAAAGPSEGPRVAIKPAGEP